MEIKYRNDFGQLLGYYKLPKIVCEVGVAEGRLSKVILSWGVDKLYLIDSWEHLEQPGDGGYDQAWHDNNLKEVKERIEGNEDKVVILRGFSIEMSSKIPDNSLGLVYIDANHAYDAVIDDLVSYYSKVVSGGIIALHDYKNLSYGVNKAAKDFFNEMGYSLSEINETVEDGDESMVSAWVIKK